MRQSGQALRRRYARVFRSLGRAELQRGAPDLSDVGLQELFEPTRELWLGYYSPEGIELAMERYGVMHDIRRKGYESLRLEVRTEDAEEHLLRVWSDLPRFDEPLIELVVRRTQLILRGELRDAFEVEALAVLSVEWLQLQHPLGVFSEERPPLPGQRLPGLGIAREVFEMLRNVCQRLELSALVTVPSYLHNAVFYGQGFRYLAPVCQGRYEGLQRELGRIMGELGVVGDGSVLAASSWALRWGLVTSVDGPRELVKWPHEPMIAPVSRQVEAYLKDDWYRAERREERARVACAVWERPLREQLSLSGLWPYDEARAGALASEQEGLTGPLAAGEDS